VQKRSRRGGGRVAAQQGGQWDAVEEKKVLKERSKGKMNAGKHRRVHIDSSKKKTEDRKTKFRSLKGKGLSQTEGASGADIMVARQVGPV